MGKKKSKKILMSFRTGMADEIKATARAQNRTPSNLIETAVIQFLEKQDKQKK